MRKPPPSTIHVPALIRPGHFFGPGEEEYIDILKSREEIARGWIRRAGCKRGSGESSREEARSTPSRRGGRDLWRGHGFYWRESKHRELLLSPSPFLSLLPRFLTVAVRKSYHAGRPGRQTIIRKEPCAKLQKAKAVSLAIEKVKSESSRKRYLSIESNKSSNSYARLFFQINKIRDVL